MNITRLTREAIRRTTFLSIRRISAASPAFLRLHNCIEFPNAQRKFSVFSKSPDYNAEAVLNVVTFESLCGETIESLTDYFEEIVEADSKLQNSDIAYSDGVLTVKLGDPHGTYVINRQTPNRQIWLSSPKSGPKRYDYIDGNWIYKHDGMSLHELLQSELKEILSIDIDFLKIALNKK